MKNLCFLKNKLEIFYKSVSFYFYRLPKKRNSSFKLACKFTEKPCWKLSWKNKRKNYQRRNSTNLLGKSSRESNSSGYRFSSWNLGETNDLDYKVRAWINKTTRVFCQSGFETRFEFVAWKWSENFSLESDGCEGILAVFDSRLIFVYIKIFNLFSEIMAD